MESKRNVPTRICILTTWILAAMTVPLKFSPSKVRMVASSIVVRPKNLFLRRVTSNGILLS